jgi:hypothetical protein
MQTERDAEIVHWIGRLGPVGAEHVMRRFGMSRSMAYERLHSLTQDGLLAHHMMLFARPGMYSATKAGLYWQNLTRLGVARVRPGGFEHAWQVSQTAVELYLSLPGWQILSERELRAVEADSRELYASVQVGQVDGHPVLHRPDLVLASPDGRVVPIEVELSVKSASRLAAICRGWARARHIGSVYYLAAAGPGRAVQRAVRTASATDRVSVLALDDVPLLAARESAREEVGNVLD